MKYLTAFAVLAAFVATNASHPHSHLVPYVVNPGGIGGIYKGPDSATIIKGPDGGVITSKQIGGAVAIDDVPSVHVHGAPLGLGGLGVGLGGPVHSHGLGLGHGIGHGLGHAGLIEAGGASAGSIHAGPISPGVIHTGPGHLHGHGGLSSVGVIHSHGLGHGLEVDSGLIHAGGVSAGSIHAGPTSAGSISVGPSSAGSISVGPSSPGVIHAGPGLLHGGPGLIHSHGLGSGLIHDGGVSAGSIHAGPSSAGSISVGPSSAGSISVGPSSAGSIHSGLDVVHSRPVLGPIIPPIVHTSSVVSGPVVLNRNPIIVDDLLIPAVKSPKIVEEHVIVGHKVISVPKKVEEDSDLIGPSGTISTRGGDTVISGPASITVKGNGVVTDIAKQPDLHLKTVEVKPVVAVHPVVEGAGTIISHARPILPGRAVYAPQAPVLGPIHSSVHPIAPLRTVINRGPVITDPLPLSLGGFDLFPHYAPSYVKDLHY